MVENAGAFHFVTLTGEEQTRRLYRGATITATEARFDPRPENQIAIWPALAKLQRPSLNSAAAKCLQSEQTELRRACSRPN